MRGDGDWAKSMTAIGPSVMVVTGVFLVFLLPSEVLAILTVWTLASLPIGVLIGHCVLNEE
jgi:hypothetical protein